MQIAAATVESSIEFPQKIKNRTALWPSDSIPGNISEEILNTTSEEYMHPYVHCNIIYSSQDFEAAQVSITRWVDKNAVVHIHSGILLRHKKQKEILPFVTSWMDLEIIIVSEISQSEKDK